MPKWEYEIQNLNFDAGDDPLEESKQMLNEMADEGWEVITVVGPDPKKGWYYAIARREAKG
jgi:hypothetical protein